MHQDLLQHLFPQYVPLNLLLNQATLVLRQVILMLIIYQEIIGMDAVTADTLNN